ncbi:MAG: NnrS family protein [Parahaliea sp.]
MSKKQEKLWAYRLFFPAAALYAAVAIPLSVIAWGTGKGYPLAYAGFGHGFELLFGFSLAVVAGFTLGPTKRNILVALFTLWLCARIAQILAPFSLPSMLINLGFGLGLASQVVPRFFAAKKLRNRMLIPLLLMIALMPGAFLIGHLLHSGDLLRLILHEAIITLSLLMAFMGGRILAPAIAGEFEQRAMELNARVQPRLEGTFTVLLFCAIPLFAIADSHVLAGIAISLAGLILLIRMVRWRLWRIASRIDLIALSVGYGWLALGLIWFGICTSYNMPIIAALHAITVGAIGTLTSGVMIRTHYLRQHRQPPPAVLAFLLMIFIALSATLRVVAQFFEFIVRQDLLWFSSLSWALCFIILTLSLVLPKASGDQHPKIK